MMSYSITLLATAAIVSYLKINSKYVAGYTGIILIPFTKKRKNTEAVSPPFYVEKY